MNGKSRGYSLESFDWSKSTLSKLLHSKQASTVERFVEVWKTDIQPHSNNVSLSINSSNSNNTPLSVPRDRTTPSQKRTAADAQLCQHTSTLPALRPVHIVSDTTLPQTDSVSTQLDEAIEKGFVGKGNYIILWLLFAITHLNISGLYTLPNLPLPAGYFTL